MNAQKITAAVSYHFLPPPDRVYCRLDSRCFFPNMPAEHGSSSAPSQHHPSALHPDPCHWSYLPGPTTNTHMFKQTETCAPDQVALILCGAPTCTEEAAPPPTPILYTGPPIFTTSIPDQRQQQRVICESLISACKYRQCMA